MNALHEHDLRYTAQLPPAFETLRVIGFAAISGGSVKTTTTVNLAVTAALRGYRIAVIGLDLQCDMTWQTGYGGHQGPTIWDVIGGQASLSEVMVPARFLIGDDPESSDPDHWQVIPRLWIAPESPELENAADMMRDKPMVYQSDWLLKEAPRLAEEFALDAIFVDFPAPSGLVVNNAIGSVTELIGCTRSQLKEFRGIKRLEQSIETVRAMHRKWDQGQDIRGIVIGDVPPTNAGHVYAEDRETIVARYEDLVLPLVPRSSIVASSYSWATPVPILKPKHKVSLAFAAIADALGFPDREGIEDATLVVPTGRAED